MRQRRTISAFLLRQQCRPGNVVASGDSFMRNRTRHLQDSLDWGGRTEGMQSDRASVTSRDCPDHRADRPVRLGLQVGFEVDVWECQPSSPRPFGHL